MTAPRRLSFVDRSRPIRAAGGFGGASERRLDALMWMPAGDGGPRPLVVYCHGTSGAPDDSTYLAEALTARGFIVVAPDFPLTSRAAHTAIVSADISDAGEQVRDVRFLLDALLADPTLSPLIDADRLGSIGHSLGAVTCWFLSFGETTRDPRIKATALLCAGDPALVVAGAGLGLADAGHRPGGTPALLVSAEHDLFAGILGPPGTAYSRLDAPKAEVTIAGGTHVWFNDNDAWPSDGKNPDCLFFEEHMPGFVPPGAERRVPLIGPERQREITLAAVTAFFDAHLRDDPGGAERLRRIAATYPEATLVQDG